MCIVTTLAASTCTERMQGLCRDPVPRSWHASGKAPNPTNATTLAHDNNFGQTPLKSCPPAKTCLNEWEGFRSKSKSKVRARARVRVRSESRSKSKSNKESGGETESYSVAICSLVPRCKYEHTGVPMQIHVRILIWSVFIQIISIPRYMCIHVLHCSKGLSPLAACIFLNLHTVHAKTRWALPYHQKPSPDLNYVMPKRVLTLLKPIRHHISSSLYP